MAPKEFERGALIDGRTTNFMLGRLVWHFGTGRAVPNGGLSITVARTWTVASPGLAVLVEQATGMRAR